MTFTINKNNSYNQYQHTNNNSKNLYIIYFILLLLVKTVGAQKTQFFFPNGNVSSEGVLKDGKPDGYWKTYFENGTLKSEGNRSNFSLDSTWKFYFSTGQLNKIINYKKNNKNGFFFLYSKEGFLLEKVNYLEDNRNGEALIFKAFVLIDSTFLKEKNNYKNNVLNDFCYSYDSIGNIITIKKYNLGMLLSKEKINRYDKNNQRHGKWKTFYANGKIEWEADYLHGKLNGKEKKYNKKGGIETIENYTNGIISENKTPVFFTLNKQLNDDGTIEEGVVVDNKKEGTFRTYDKKGKLVVCNNYKNNIRLSSGLVDSLNFKIGEWIYFYEDGSIKAKGIYNKDIQEGLWEYFFSNSVLQQKGRFINGKPDGEWIWWHSNAVIHRKETFKNGKEEGEIIEQDSVGKIITKGYYVNGRKEGGWYYYVNDHKEEGYFVDDLKDGEWKTTYSNGFLSFEGSFINGIPIDQHIYYFNNGKVKEIGKYSNGQKDGEWKKYNLIGEVVLSIVYKNGEEFKIDGIKVKKKKNKS